MCFSCKRWLVASLRVWGLCLRAAIWRAALRCARRSRPRRWRAAGHERWLHSFWWRGWAKQPREIAPRENLTCPAVAAFLAQPRATARVTTICTRARQVRISRARASLFVFPALRARTARTAPQPALAALQCVRMPRACWRPFRFFSGGVFPPPPPPLTLLPLHCRTRTAQSARHRAPTAPRAPTHPPVPRLAHLSFPRAR